MNNLATTLSPLTRLRQGGTAYGKAMHKPVLLLAMFEALDTGEAEAQHLPVDAALKRRFDAVWRALIPNQTPGDFFKPVYHLPNEGFWEVLDAHGKPVQKEYESLKRAAADGLWARFTGPLAEVIASREGRAVARMVLLNHYFAQTQQYYDHDAPDQLLAAEPAVHPYEKDPRFVHTLRLREYRGFVRDWRFRQDVLRIYNHTCCMTGLRAEFFGNYPLLDAAHIEQHAHSGIDAPTNGLALSKTMHAAFDNGLVALTDDYRILVSKDVKESPSTYGLASLANQKMLLPADPLLHPLPKRLAWHRDRWGF
jgi:putative restriction endonuclease